MPKRYVYVLFGVIQSGLTCAIAAAISNVPFAGDGSFIGHWIRAWLFSWVTMVPVVIVAAPAIRRVVDRLTR